MHWNNRSILQDSDVPKTGMNEDGHANSERSCLANVKKCVCNAKEIAKSFNAILLMPYTGAGWIVLISLAMSNPCDLANSVSSEKSLSSICGVLLNNQRYFRSGVPTTEYS